MGDPIGGTPEQIRARMKVYERWGNVAGYSLIGGLCGMSVAAIWSAPAWAYNGAASAAAVGGIVVAFMLLNYSGAKALLKDAEKPDSHSSTNKSS